MDTRLTQTAARYGGPALLLGRLLLAFIFLHEAVNLALSPSSSLSAMAKIGVPAPLAAMTILFQIFAGTSLAFGWQSRLAALALGVFCVTTAVLFHMRLDIRNEVLHLQKDLAIAGGMFVLAVSGAGSWSVDALLRTQKAFGLAVE